MQSRNRLNILIDTISQDQAQASIAFSRLLLLRWGALACQSFIVLMAVFLTQIKPPLPVLALILIFSGGTNLYFHLLFQKKNRFVPGRFFALVMTLDVLLLTVLLYYTGGPMNPFTFLFLIHVCLGAVLMRPFWAWSMAALTTLSYGVLFFLPDPSALAGRETPEILCQAGPAGMTNSMTLHLQGMWFAFAVTVFFVVFFLNKIQKDLEEHQKTVSELEMERTRSEKLASLATLSAGAAHEFSTPLATIAIAAGEMLTTLTEQPSDQELIADTILIRDQVQRCREILYQMSADAGEHLAEALRVFTVGELWTEVYSRFPEKDRQRIHFHSTINDFRIRMPFRTVKRIIRGLIKNGLDASGDTGKVEVFCRKDDEYLYIEVQDRGCGMNKKILERAVEPFFTTKDPGKGLGLGLFLAETAAERLGGSLKLSSRQGKGTRAVISFALARIRCP